jgi:hypothetical protein
LLVSGNTNLTSGGILVKKANRSRWFEALAPSAQMFRGLGKGFYGRGRGMRLAEVPASEAAKEKQEGGRPVVFHRAA